MVKTKDLIRERLEDVVKEIEFLEREIIEKTTLYNGCEDIEEKIKLEHEIELQKRRLTVLTAKRTSMIDYIEGD